MPFFYVLLISSVVVEYSSSVYLTTVVDYGLDKQLSLTDAETVVSYATVGDILGFFILPSVADCKYLSRGALNTASFIVLAAAMFFQSMANTYRTFVTASGIFRLGIACSQTMRTVLVGDYLGPESLSLVWALTGILSIPVLLVNPSIIGT